MPALVPPPPPPPPPPAPAPSEDLAGDPLAALESIRAKCGQGDAVKVVVSRVVGGVHYRISDATSTFESFDLDEIGRTYGGGKYRLSVQDERGRFVGSTTVLIDGEPRDPASANRTRTAPAATPSLDPAELGKVIAMAVAEANRPLLEALARRKEVSELDMLDRAITIMDKRIQPAAAAAVNPIQQVKDTLALVQELPGVGQESPGMSLLAEAVVGLTDAAKPLFAAWGQKIAADIRKPRQAAAVQQQQQPRQIANQASPAGEQAATMATAEPVEAELVESSQQTDQAGPVILAAVERVVATWKAQQWPAPTLFAAQTLRAMLDSDMAAFVANLTPDALCDILATKDAQLVQEPHKAAVYPLCSQLITICKEKA